MGKLAVIRDTRHTPSTRRRSGNGGTRTTGNLVHGRGNSHNLDVSCESAAKRRTGARDGSRACRPSLERQLARARSRPAALEHHVSAAQVARAGESLLDRGEQAPSRLAAMGAANRLKPDRTDGVHGRVPTLPHARDKRNPTPSQWPLLAKFEAEQTTTAADARGGTRTHTSLRTALFKRTAYTDSATRARPHPTAGPDAGYPQGSNFSVP